MLQKHNYTAVHIDMKDKKRGVLRFFVSLYPMYAHIAVKCQLFRTLLKPQYVRQTRNL